MPSEVRQILFANSEVLSAIQMLYRRSYQAFPIGTPENIVISEDNSCQFACDVVDEESFREHVAVAGEKLAAALILFCMSRKIPIPATAHKRLSIVRGQLALGITLPDTGGMVDRGRFWTTPGFTTELMYLFEASDLRKTKINPDEDEVIEVNITIITTIDEP